MQQQVLQEKELSKQLSDEAAFTQISWNILTSAHDNWLQGQFERRTPWNKRERLSDQNKDGHPLVLPITLLPLMKHISEGIYVTVDVLEQDKLFVKQELARYFKVSVEQFNYLDVLTLEEFKDWMISSYNSIIKGNQHWAFFVQRILSYNSIDFSDLVEGKLNLVDRSILTVIYSYLLQISSSRDINELLKLLGESVNMGIIQGMINVHGEWRKTAYKLENIIEATGDCSIDKELAPEIQLDVMNSISDVLFGAENYTAVTLSDAIRNLRAKYEQKSDVTAETTFMIMLFIAKYLAKIKAYRKEGTSEYEAISGALNTLVQIITMDANPAPLKTVLDIQGEAMQRVGFEG